MSKILNCKDKRALSLGSTFSLVADVEFLVDTKRRKKVSSSAGHWRQSESLFLKDNSYLLRRSLIEAAGKPLKVTSFTKLDRRSGTLQRCVFSLSFRLGFFDLFLLLFLALPLPDELDELELDELELDEEEDDTEGELEEEELDDEEDLLRFFLGDLDLDRE